jgi:hypothetical protein
MADEISSSLLLLLQSGCLWEQDAEKEVESADEGVDHSSPYY